MTACWNDVSRRFLVVAILAVSGCDGRDATTLFERLSPRRTGVTFANELPEDSAFNIVNYLNYYNGGGVAAGDVDGDGLADLYFTSNLNRDRLYRNLGDFRFADVTERAGVGNEPGWTSGVTMADVDGDGHLDIYVSTVTHLTLHGRNVLYINNGDGTFTDRTEQYGLQHIGYSTQATFFDYDGDGDLDVYLLNHSTHAERGAPFNRERRQRHPTAGDRLMRNDGAQFVDVSEAAGIFGGAEGYGLGVVASDLNLDGCVDLFVANDFDEGDFLYLNNCDGTFTESIAGAMPHTTRSSMGADAADFNNDGRPDVVVVDMLPEREDIRKTSANADDFNIDHLKRQAGYHPQYARNTLHLNRGGGRFSDIGYLAGIHATDWSWAPLFADFDNDGWKDLLVTNGIYRRPNDLDFITYVAGREIQAALEDGITAQLLRTLLDRMPHVPIANYVYRNNGDLTFTNVAAAWGLGRPGFSTGTVYVDLDNDGALDLVTNDINAPAGIYRNRANAITGHRHLGVRLRGSGANTAGIGAKVIIKNEGGIQLLEQMPTRGFQSSIDPRLHFGLGTATRVDSLFVIWPDHRFQVLTDVAADQTVVLSQDDATDVYAYGAQQGTAQQRFENVTAQLAVDYEHEENTFFDFNREPLIPHKLSTEGPALVIGDVNGDGLDDLFAGGAKWQPGRLLVQQRGGRFVPTNVALFRNDSLHEDVDAALFDADGDADLDLYVVSAGNEFWADHPPLQDRLYLNDGNGRFTRSTDRLPPLYQNGSCVTPGDFDADGDVDLFVGGRVVSRQYGVIPTSYLLQNDGTGRFTDVTAERAPGLSKVGMVTSAAWSDVDADGRLDLIVVGEWMPVRVLQQRNGRLEDRTDAWGFTSSNGWWNTVRAADLNDDGRDDLVLGNLGLNSYVRGSHTEPVRLYVHDFARNGVVQQILTVFSNGVSYPLAGRDEFLTAIPPLRERYPTYTAFGASTIEELMPSSELRQARVLEAYLFASAVALHDGESAFTLHPLPTEAQFAPIYATLANDFDGDGRTDLLVAGNFHGVQPVRGQYDAGWGLVLLGDGAGGFAPVDLASSNLVLTGQVRDLKMLRLADGSRALVAARNDDRLQIVRVPTTSPPATRRGPR